jgi:hypothetical protein
MNLSLLFLIIGLACKAEPQVEYSRGSGALGVTDGPPANPGQDPTDTGDTGDTGDSGDSGD